jgi:hypothetical protein
VPATNEPVVLRRLPGGDAQNGCLQGAERDRLKISLTPGEVASFTLGALVEVASDETLYFGQVVGGQGPLLIVRVEHSVNRGALAAIQDHWKGSKGT